VEEMHGYFKAAAFQVWCRARALTVFIGGYMRSGVKVQAPA
jgi:hypothetical protein